MRALAAVLLMLLAVVLGGCGYAGEPLPPALRRPARVTDLQAAERGASIVVQFSIPKTTTEDLAIEGPQDVELRIGLAAEGGFDPDVWQRTSDRVPNVPQDQAVARVAIPVANYTGKTVVVGVNVHGPQGRSAGWSNFVVVPVVSPLPKPQGLEATDAADAIALDWHAAAGEFRIYRKTLGDASFVLLGSVTRPPYADAAIEYGKSYQYYVETTEKTGETVALSEPSEEVTFKPVDKFAPAVPAEVAAVPGARRIELVWARNVEKDFAGYRVYRNGQRLADNLTAPSFSDQSVQPGTKYQYQISAFDATGNESAKSPVAEAEIP